MAYEQGLELADLTDTDSAYRICGLIDKLSLNSLVGMRVKNKTPSISNIFNILNGKSIHSRKDYDFMTPSSKLRLWSNEEVLAKLRIEHGTFGSFSDATPYREVNLTFPNGLDLKSSGEFIPGFRIHYLEKQFPEEIKRTRGDYFLGFFGEKTNLSHIIPTNVFWALS